MRYGNYEFRVVSFGLTKPPATFIFLMNNELCPYLDTFVIFFVDGILAYSKTKEEHKENLEIALKFLRYHKIYSNLIKWNLC